MAFFGGSLVILLLYFSLTCEGKPRSRLTAWLRYPIHFVARDCAVQLAWLAPIQVQRVEAQWSVKGIS